jgi:hypothetical protein
VTNVVALFVIAITLGPIYLAQKLTADSADAGESKE